MNWIKRLIVFGGDTRLHFGGSKSVSKTTIIKQQKAEEKRAAEQSAMFKKMMEGSSMEMPAMPAVPKPPPIPPPVTPPTQGDVSQAGTDAREQSMRRKGMQKSILAGETGGYGGGKLGSTASPAKAASKKTLLG